MSKNENPVDARKKNWKSNMAKVAGKTILGASFGVAGGMVLVAGVAAVEGALLSWLLFAKVLGVAGAASGLSHGIVSIADEKKQNAANKTEEQKKKSE